MAKRAAAERTAGAALIAYAPRERARRIVRGAFPRRHGRVLIARTAAEFARAVRMELADAAIVDISAEEAWEVSSFARELPSIPFFALTPLHTTDAAAVGRAAMLDYADILVESVDDAVLGQLVHPHRFTTRLRRALHEPPPQLHLAADLHRDVWRCLVARAGRPMTTGEVAQQLGVTREHLSRSVTRGGSPTLKRLIDLVRLIVAAELAKNPGYDVADVARILSFASSSHLATTTQRLLGTRSTSLARLRTVDILERFSRVSATPARAPSSRSTRDD